MRTHLPLAPLPLTVLTTTLLRCTAQAGIGYDPATQRLTLDSGPTELRLQVREGAVALEYLGPAGGPAWPAAVPEGWSTEPPRRQESAGVVEGRAFGLDGLRLLEHATSERHPGVAELQLVFEHRAVPLRLDVRYATWGDSGVITRRVTLTNSGAEPLRVQSLPSLAWRLPAGEYELSYLHGGWGWERQLATEPLGAGQREFIQDRGRSTQGQAPWFCLRNATLGIRYAAQLAWSGNWQMSFERRPSSRPVNQEDVRVELGMRFDFGGPLTLEPGRTFALPEVAFTASAGTLDDAANHLHRYQSEFVLPRSLANDPLLVQFNSWYPFPGKMTVGDMKRCADIAAGLGAEVFVLDAGWYNKVRWERELGDWQHDPVAFPNGLGELSQHVRSRGMRFGLWLEIENLGADSQMLPQHPDWCLSLDGKPVGRDARYQLDFAKPEVRTWARGVFDRLARETKMGWVKMANTSSAPRSRIWAKSKRCRPAKE